MISSDSFFVFEKWKNAPNHAFGSQNQPSLVPDEDKRAYESIFNELMNAAEASRSNAPDAASLMLKPMSYSPQYGSRGHRPVDLWVAICGVESEAFGKMPQVYAIASERGLEIGFAVSINEADYHNPEVKARNRLIVPLLNSKLPSSSESIVQRLESRLAGQGGWRFNTKTRLQPGRDGWDRYHSLGDMLDALRAGGAVSGGGTACRVFSPNSLAKVDINQEFEAALRLFLPFITRCRPTAWDESILQAEDHVQELADEGGFDPASIIDGRRLVLAAVARRQGQVAFRKRLLKAYGGRCAVTGTPVTAVLQAAHIWPYLGPQTNHVTNGLLLRADIHSLFDIGLLRIEPGSLAIRISDALRGTPYEEFEGRVISSPSRPSERPNKAALQRQFDELG